MDNQYREAQGWCECCNKYLAKTTYYRHLQQRLNQNKNHQTTLNYEEDLDSHIIDSLPSSSPSEDSGNDRDRFWTPNSTPYAAKLLRYIKIKIEHNINDKGFIDG
jgi:hypothetical protein